MRNGRNRLGLVATSAGLLIATAACSEDTTQQSMLNPAGEHSRIAFDLWVWMAVLGGLVWVIVTILLFIAVLRRKGIEKDATVEGSQGRRAAMSGRPVTAVVVAGALIPAVIITFVAWLAISSQREVDMATGDARPVAQVVGHQFWWEVEYVDHGIISANEIHIPAGERVRVELSSADVIHSLWVPELGGKADLIPGQSNPLWLEADEPGVYWGQCAEYCGEQHAQMRLVVVAHEPAEYEAWLEAHSHTAQASPTIEQDEPDPLVAHGRQVFLSSSCVYCHAVQGSAATGQAGPDLTHLGNRLRIASGILPNDSESLAAWILDPQSIKPGALMPGTDVDPDDLEALVAYLESLE